jgi:hypothetical protein
MKETLVLTEYPDVCALAPTRYSTQDRFVLTLVALGILASLVAFISYQQALKYQLKPDEFYGSSNVVKSQVYYAAHAAQIILLISAGLVTVLFTNWRTIERGYGWRFSLFLCAVLLMTVRGYSFGEMLSTKITDGWGPVPFFISLLVFIGARRSYWALLSKVMVALAVLFSALTLQEMVGLHTFTRQEGVVNLGGILNALYWPASWLVLQEYPHNSIARRLRFAPIAIYSLGSLFTQTRLLFVMLIALFVVYAYVQRRRKIPQAAFWIGGAILTVWAGLFTTVFLKDTRSFQKFESVIDAFSSRLTEDTRTGQVVSFMRDVQPHELVLGRGSLATWNWGGMEWHGGTDIGFLTLLFYGGIPLLLTYAATHVKPCLTIFRRNQPSWRLADAGVVLLWGIHLFSSGYPHAGIPYYPVLFCVGATISRESLPVSKRTHVSSVDDLREIDGQPITNSFA